MLLVPYLRIGFSAMANVNDAFKHIILQAKKKAASEYTPKLRDYADSYGWPKNLTDNLKLIQSGNGHTVAYPESLREEVLTLEYGTQDVPPSPVMRTFMSKMDSGEM